MATIVRFVPKPSNKGQDEPGVHRKVPFVVLVVGAVVLGAVGGGVAMLLMSLILAP